ncbi:uncharacterized protein LOC127265196 [Andrographis paniculata]|uniref:uncharacterized protein LOC127265196 n=1 Tax=Andrographis paniculata TaxID=175694 RepID=UPI0021E945FE|nr:uncharacterized protein LOC127265196 [Andrographis paniculata]
MKLLAEVLTGTSFYVEVGEDATVGDLKKEIGQQENLPVDRLTLMVGTDPCSMLDNDIAPLEDYGIQESSHIYIFFEPVEHDSPSASFPQEATSSPNESISSSKEDPSSPTEPSVESSITDIVKEPSDQEDTH